MCDLSEYTTKAMMKNDLNSIKYKLFDVQKNHPKIYTAIEPLVSHLISHLEKVHQWIEPVNIQPKTDRQLAKEEHVKWFNENNPRLVGNDYYSARDISEKAWLIAKGFCA